MTRYPELRKWMKQNGYNQRKLAKAIHITPSAMCRTLKGDDEFQLDDCIRLHLTTGLPIECFLMAAESQLLIQLYGERLMSSSENAK